LHELLLDSYSGDNTKRIPVECKINLSKKLLNPSIKFDILFPTADERTKSELQQFISTQDDINRKCYRFLVMGQFFTPEYLRGQQALAPIQVLLLEQQHQKCYQINFQTGCPKSVAVSILDSITDPVMRLIQTKWKWHLVHRFQ